VYIFALTLAVIYKVSGSKSAGWTWIIAGIVISLFSAFLSSIAEIFMMLFAVPLFYFVIVYAVLLVIGFVFILVGIIKLIGEMF
jgi:hypothetical protein